MDPSAQPSNPAQPATPQPNPVSPTPEAQQPAPTPEPIPTTQPPKPASPAKNLFHHWQTWVFVALGALSIISLAFGGFELSENMLAQERVADLEQQITEKDAQIVKYAAQIAQQVENSSRPGYIDPSTNTAERGYIYVGEWGIKIKIPNSLKYASYNYTTNLTQLGDEISTVCVWATPRVLESIPAFADPSQNSRGLGCATRYHVDAVASSSQGETFYQNGDYYYRFVARSATSKDEAERVLETQAIDAVASMFTTDNFTTF